MGEGRDEGDLYSPPRLPRHSSTTYQNDRISFSPRAAATTTVKSTYPVQTRYDHHRQQKRKNNLASSIPLALKYHESIGHPSLNIHRLRLPYQFLSLLDEIVDGCEEYAARLSSGWNTDLYSLTKQDIALRETPNVYRKAKPILSYVKRVAAFIYGIQGVLKVDRNQPHVLKYSGSHQGVELHHDKCDITVNIMLSRSDNYVGGGTYFPDAGNVRLEFGEFLLHPGGCVHGGSNIESGTRHLMVIFANEA